MSVRKLQLSRDLQRAVNQAVEDGNSDLVHEANRALCNLDDYQHEIGLAVFQDNAWYVELDGNLVFISKWPHPHLLCVRDENRRIRVILSSSQDKAKFVDFA